ncbi:hypothetical protein GGR56DRAFT_668474 [Xylariaceae sp. FL0804]|nr:hypothetical protein GGR56DRAFT_668474 [Xylariaceae sp. FL0804]
MEEYSEESKRGLLGSRNNEHDDSLNQTRKRPSLRSWMAANTISLTTITLLVYIALLLTANASHDYIVSRKTFQQSGPYSIFTLLHPSTLPRQHYEERLEWYPGQYPWNQEPSEALDATWKDLLTAQNIHVTEDEMSRTGLNTTNLVRIRGGGYFGVLGVYHHLHCLNNLRRALHWDYYEAKFGASGKDLPGFTIKHTDHCLDTIRQALMCHADTSLYTREWDEETRVPGAEISPKTPTMCVHWDSLDSWARLKALSREEEYGPGPFE